MTDKAVYFLKKTLGEDFFEDLAKTELYKPGTRTVTSLEDIHLGLKLVPRTIMGLLIRELVPMKVNEHKEISLPVMGEAQMNVQKLGPDVYSGQIFAGTEKVTEFSHRPIPGVALVIMSAFELYEQEEPEAQPSEGQDQKVMQMIDERLRIHDLVNRVVTQKLEEREAVQQLMLARITQAMQPAPEPVVVVAPPAPKGSPLKDFLENRKLKKNEFFVSLEKNETVDCADCGKEIFNASGYSGCICYGADRNSKVSIKKTENGIRLSFGRGWDPENLEMLLEVLRSKRG